MRKWVLNWRYQAEALVELSTGSLVAFQIYLHAGIELKEKALSNTEPFKGNLRRYRPPDQLLEFLNTL